MEEEKPIMYKRLGEDRWCWVCPWCHRSLLLARLRCPVCRHYINPAESEEYKGELTDERKKKNVQKQHPY